MWQSIKNIRRSITPRKLFSRSLLIVVVPVILMQVGVTLLFLERHWTNVTQHLSRAAINEISLLVDLRLQELGADATRISQMGNDAFEMSIAFLPGASLPRSQNPSPFTLELLHRSLSLELENQIGRPFTVDTTTYDNYVDIRILLPGEVMRILAQRKRVYATNTHIFIFWMVGTTILLLGVAVIFLRNQIRPITRLAEAAEAFGKGRDVANFRPSGASEVRRAATSFIEMRNRIKRQIEQRTTMLAGVSHDLRTPLTRLKLQLTMMPDQDGVEELKADLQEMEDMLEDYLAFARGYQGEHSAPTQLRPFIEQIHQDTKRRWEDTKIELLQAPEANLAIKPKAFRRCITNLINNACAHAAVVQVAAYWDREKDRLHIVVDDNGEGISEDKLEDVFRPFYRLDDARTDIAGTGLGLTIARDVARGHGGDIRLSRSDMGGLRAHITIPV